MRYTELTDIRDGGAGEHRVEVAFLLTDLERDLWRAGVLAPSLAATPLRDRAGGVHFIYNAASGKSASYYCSCRTGFRDDLAAAVAHLQKVSDGTA